MNDSSSNYLNDLYINCVDPDDEGIDFDGDIPNEIHALIERENERHAKPLKEEVVSINWKDENDPRMVQVGSTLSLEEHRTSRNYSPSTVMFSHGFIKTWLASISI
ncbi:hypothetical protein RHMOL_Rhmol11G0030600 [Rhododendron molle]|uniref:Uncharacterized protein n=1 Tax=Rhododendron molle TaxID=49168 RepID=A0ACC0LMV9_RHOML|nr:hypothetical protein RHMOL_Rhmol11G0030600 [Rhododendron molle]